jgi:hypothetical protein
MRRRPDYLEMSLWAYPKSYRERRGEEILSTLREGAPARGSFEGLRAGLDVVAHGLRLRAGTASQQLGGRVLAAAALPGMAMAAASATAMLCIGLLLSEFHHHYPVDFGPDTAIWPALYLVWLLGGLSALALPRSLRIGAATCIVASLVTMFVQPHQDWPWLPALSLLIALCVPALLAPRTPSSRSHRGFALLIGGTCLGVLAAVAASNTGARAGGPISYLEFRTFAPWVAGSALLCSAILLAVRRWIDASGVVLVAIPWLIYGTFDQQTFGGGSPTFYAVWVELACSVAVGVIGIGIARLKSTSEPAY